MKNILSSLITLLIGISLFFIGVKNLWPDFFLNQEVRIGAGIFFIIIGFIGLVWKVFRIKNKNILDYIGVVIGILLITIGLFLILRNSPYWAAPMMPGIYFFVANFLGILKRKFPEQKDNSFTLISNKNKDLKKIQK